MTDKPRLIEVAFPLQQASMDSVHEKSVRHGHISTLHIWPARRPLAASRAALIAALLDDPGDPEERRKLLERLGGRVVKEGEILKKNGKQILVNKDQTVGGVLHWGQEKSPDIDYFRKRIHEKFGRPPRVLDPFAGGGAIPLEAMRMGCETTAIDINPVAWFILKCTLEYPQKLAGKMHPLPDFALQNREFMEQYFKAQGMTKRQIENRLASLKKSSPLPGMQEPIEENIAWHVRAWGMWVLQQAKKELKRFYPIVDGKTTVAYLWARTVECKSCRATIPLLKTRWLARKDKKRIVLVLESIRSEEKLKWRIETNPGENETGRGTMTKSGATCPSCNAIMTQSDIRHEAVAGKLGEEITCVVVNGERGKEYRLPTTEEVKAVKECDSVIKALFEEIPFGLLNEPIPKGGSRRGGGSPFTAHIYGFDRWGKIFNARQTVALGTFLLATRNAKTEMQKFDYSPQWIEAMQCYLACIFDRLNVYSSSLCRWINNRETVAPTFARYALPILWDYCETQTTSDLTGGYGNAIVWVSKALNHLLHATSDQPSPIVINQSAIKRIQGRFDVLITDPPYYDAIPYSDLMDFFHVWLRRILHGLTQEIDERFSSPLGPKWNEQENDGELIDDASRFNNDLNASKSNYEEGMFRALQNGHQSLLEDGRAVIVFANKSSEAWETLVSAVIRSGFVVTGSWPIQTERGARPRAHGSAALSSSIWLVCRKRSPAVPPGWDSTVIGDMERRIVGQLRDFWDAGIRGPDFVWTATGPALEAYSKHPVVKKANNPGELLTVSEFLDRVRRIVVDFVVGLVLSQNGSAEDMIHLDNVTNYYLLHRYDYGMDDTPVNAAILYAMSCNISDKDLLNQYGILQSAKNSDVKLVPWHKRNSKNMGYQVSGGRSVPLIDKAHRLMHLWKAGDLAVVNEYLEAQGLRRDVLFIQLLQALIELSTVGSDERAYLESISNHLGITVGQEVERLIKD